MLWSATRMCDESQEACNFLVDLVEMAKVNYQSVRQENRRIVLIRSMFERAKRRRRMVESVLHSLLSRKMRLIKLAMALDHCMVLVAFAGKNAATPVRRRSCRRLSRNAGWWNIIWQTYSDARFTFRDIQSFTGNIHLHS